MIKQITLEFTDQTYYCSQTAFGYMTASMKSQRYRI